MLIVYLLSSWYMQVAHALGAPHSFASGGLMSYTGEAAFSEGDEVCAAISSQAAGTGGCLTEAAAVCGDGVTLP